MDLKKFNFRDPKVRNPVLIWLVGIGLIYLWWDKMFVPLQKSLKDKMAQEKQLRNRLNAILVQKPRVELLKEEIKKLEVEFSDLKEMFPDKEEIPKLIKQMTMVGLISGVKTTRFLPIEDLEKQYYVENRYNVSIVGGYHEFGDFISRVESLPMIINISKVNLEANAAVDVNKKVDQHTPTIVANFEMSTFSSKK